MTKYLTVDKDGTERKFHMAPLRKNDQWQVDFTKLISMERYPNQIMMAKLPKGTIGQITGNDSQSWEDEPIKYDEEN